MNFARWEGAFVSPRMFDGVGLTGKYTRQFSFSRNRFARRAAVFDFLAVFFFHCGHRIAFDVEFVWHHLQNVKGAGFYAFGASVAFVSVYCYEVVA